MSDAAGSDNATLRLDLYLKRLRLIKRRTIIKKLCEGGHVSVNGLSARAGKAVRAGDVIGLPSGRRVKVTAVPAEKSVKSPERYYENVPGDPAGA